MEREDALFSNKDLWLLLWPLLVETLLQFTVGFADIFMVASLGEASVSGVSLVDQINVLIQQIFAALATGGAVVCAQYIGSKNFKMANETARQLIYVVCFIALTLLTLGLIFYKPLLRIIFGAVEDKVMASSQKYFLITLFALPGIALYNSSAALFRAQGNSRISMLTSLVVNIANVAGNAILIYGFKCGVEGVAIPTLVSKTVAAFVLMYLLYNAKEYKGKPAVSIKGISKVHFEWHLVGKILRIGVPNGIESSAFQLGKIIVLSLIATFGTAAIAANACANTIASFQVFAGHAIGTGMLTVVGQCMGAGKTEQASYYTKKLMAITYVSMWIMNIPILIFAKQLIGIYGMNEETNSIAFLMVLSHGLIGMFLWPLSFTLPNALRAAGDAAFTMVVCLVSMWLIRVGMSYVFKYTGIFGLVEKLGWPVSWGAAGAWFAMNLDWVGRGSFFTGRFLHGKWKTKKVI